MMKLSLEHADLILCSTHLSEGTVSHVASNLFGAIRFERLVGCTSVPPYLIIEYRMGLHNCKSQSAPCAKMASE